MPIIKNKKTPNLGVFLFSVEPERIELSSKQAIKKLSTCLVPDWILDKRRCQEQQPIA